MNNNPKQSMQYDEPPKSFMMKVEDTAGTRKTWFTMGAGLFFLVYNLLGQSGVLTDFLVEPLDEHFVTEEEFSELEEKIFNKTDEIKGTTEKIEVELKSLTDSVSYTEPLDLKQHMMIQADINKGKEVLWRPNNDN